MSSKLPRVLIVLTLILAGILLVGIFVISQWLDPGDAGDTSTDLITPTLSTDSARVFEVSVDESQVDFVGELPTGADVDGVFPINAGTITLEPVDDQLRVLVHLRIDVDNVTSENPVVEPVLRGSMHTGDHPLAFFVATSRELVPVTEEEITFTLDGELEVNNVTQPHSMAVRAQLVGGDMWAIATSELDLADHDVNLATLMGDSAIDLTARLQSYEIDYSESDSTPESTPEPTPEP